MPEQMPPAIPDLTDGQKRRQRMRNIAIGLCLAALVVMFYVRTMIVISSNIGMHAN